MIKYLIKVLKVTLVILIAMLINSCILSKKNKNCDAYSYKEKVINDNNGVINGDSVRVAKCCK
tara:strand:+ start:4808 stop:4996 length:189 start_codon:yes stop_codon:yes gene_type:complete